MKEDAQNSHLNQILNKRRFEFGRNWSNYINYIDDERINVAIDSIISSFGTNNLEGKRYLDVGCGSGLFSLAARRLGADVVSFDFDPLSVESTRQLKNKYFKNDDKWLIMEGSILDDFFIKRLGEFDIVYSWGVLHHTGDMWGSFENIDCLVKENGMLYLALYNKGKNHVHWSKIKKLYVNSSKLLKYIILLCSFVIIYAKLIIKDFIKLKPFQSIKFAKINRGMTAWHDLIDWVGGFPYETATADEIFTYFKKRKYNLEKIRTVGSSLNCNEFLFIKRIH